MIRMNNYDAIKILESERDHVKAHMLDAGLNEEYLSNLFTALDKGISAIKKLDKIRKEAESL